MPWKQPLIATLHKGEIWVRFEYSKDYVDRIKKIPGRTWKPDVKTWIVPLSSKDKLMEEFSEEIVWTSEGGTSKVDYYRDIKVDTSVSADLKIQPYPYQWIGSSFLYKRKKAMIADQMGLGKSLQALISFLLLKRDNHGARAVIFCPASLKYQWASEIQKFTNLRSTVIDGDKDTRFAQYVGQPDGSDILIINYELMYHDYDLIKAIVNDMVDVMILDEAQKVKNWKAEISKMFKGHEEKDKETKEVTQVYEGLHTKYVWMLTGTPMENNPDEIFNLFTLIDPDILGAFWAFKQKHIILGKFNNVLGYKNLDKLHQKLSPHMIRRRICDVDQEFPEVRYESVVLDMQPLQRRLHEVIREDLLRLLQSGNASDELIQGRISLLMMVANSPELLSMSESKFARGMVKAVGAKPSELKDSPKLTWLEDFIKETLSEAPDTKFVVFTRSEKFMRLINDRLLKFTTTTTLSGSMDALSREESKIRFVDGDSHVFISTDAGAKGLNLQVASILINVDVPWNPAVLEQRGGRIVRLGSMHKRAHIINLLSKDSIDERIQQALYLKSSNIQLVVEKTEEETEAVRLLNNNVLFDLLKGRK